MSSTRRALSSLGSPMTTCAVGVALIFGLVAAPAPAAAQSKRYTTLFEEHLDGAKQPTSAAENKLMGLLINAGVTFIDEAQSRKIRSVTDAGQLMAGKISPVITSLDADIIVAGICRLSAIKSDLLGEGMHRYDASIQAKVIAVDTGQVLGAYQVRGEAIDFVASQAGEKAAAQAADRLAKEILKARANASARAELIVTGIPNVTAGDKVLQAVKGLAGVKEVRMLQSGRGMTKLEMKLEQGKTARDVALALDGTSGLGLSVFGYSERAIKAQYAPEAAMQVPVVLTPLAQAGKGKKGDAWQGPALAGILGTSLSNLQFVQLPKGTDTVALGKQKKWAGKIQKLGADPASALVLAGSYQRSGDNVTVSARLVIAGTGDTIMAGNKTCPYAEVSKCAASLGDELSQDLLKNMLAKRHLFKGKVDLKPQRMVASGGGNEAKPLEFGGLSLDNIFPARLSAYANTPVGKLTVTNKGDAPLTNVIVTTQLPGFTTGPLDTKLEDLKPGETREIPIKVVLDRSKLVRHDENQPAVMAVAVNYNDGEFRIEEKRSKALVVYDRNTLSWKEADSVSAFVTPRTSVVQGLAKGLAKAQGEAANKDPLSLASALFVGLGFQNIGYQKDPVNPYGAEALDYVQYPEQTLANKSGDCDDLAVLYASLAEALGLRMLFVTTPSHVFVAVHTGVPQQNAATLSLEKGDLLYHEGMAWIPLETTLIGKSVHAAWQAAAKELKRWSGEADKVQVIDLRTAWQKFPPVSLIADSPTVTPSDAKQLLSAVEREVELLKAERSRQLKDALAKVEKRLAKTPKDGKLLLQKGFLLALSDKTDEALAAFKDASQDKTLKGRALNNVGNIHMARGQVPEARKAYKDAIGKKAEDTRVLVNAALAAHAAGDEDAFAEYIFNVLELGAEELVLSLSQAGISVEAGTRGADTGGLAARDLSDAIRAVYKKKGKKVPAKMKKDGTRASNASAGQMPLRTYLFWL